MEAAERATTADRPLASSSWRWTYRLANACQSDLASPLSSRGTPSFETRHVVDPGVCQRRRERAPPVLRSAGRGGIARVDDQVNAVRDQGRYDVVSLGALVANGECESGCHGGPKRSRRGFEQSSARGWRLVLIPRVSAGQSRGQTERYPSALTSGFGHR